MQKPENTGRMNFRLSQAKSAQQYLDNVGIEGFNLSSGRKLAELANSFLKHDHDKLIRAWRAGDLGQKARPTRGDTGKKRLNLFGLAVNGF